MPSSNTENVADFLRNWKIDGIASLRKASRDNAFRKELVEVLLGAAKRNGSTLTLSTAAASISVAVGSIGIAGLGSAVGLPLAVVLIPLGLLGGGFLDEDGLLAGARKRFYGLFEKKGREQDEASNGETILIVEALELVSEKVDALTDDVETLKLKFAETLLVHQRQRLWLLILSLLCFLAFTTSGIIAYLHKR